MENNEFQKVGIKNHICYCLSDTIKTEDFDFNPLLNGKLHQNILIRDVL